MPVSKNRPRAFNKHPKVLKTPMPVSKNRPRALKKRPKVLKTPMPVSKNRPRALTKHQKVLKTPMPVDKNRPNHFQETLKPPCLSAKTSLSWLGWLICLQKVMVLLCVFQHLSSNVVIWLEVFA
jgi:hypothetical protein